MQRKYITVLILVIILLTLLLTTCTSEVSYIDDEADDSPLTVYVLEENYKHQNFIDNYNLNSAKDNRSIKVIKFSKDEEEDMYEQIANEILLGKGPDIIFIDQNTHQYMDVCKIARQNAFADMDILIERDGEFDCDAYNTMALDAGIIEGMRIMMPTSYKVDYLIGVEECFENNGLDIPEKLNMDSYLTLIEAYHQVRPNEPALLGIDPMYLLAEYIKVDQPIEKSDELKRILEVLKEENLRMGRDFNYIDDYNSWLKYWPLQHRVELGFNPTIGYLSFFIENNLMFKKSHIETKHEFYGLHEYYNLIKYNGGNAFILEQPLRGNGPTKAYAEEFITININSKHKNDAFDFIKFMMSDNRSYDKNYNISLPISLEGYEYNKKDLLDGYFLFSYPDSCNELFNDPIVDEVQLPDKIVDQLIDYVESVETCEYIGQFRYAYLNVINQTIEDYCNEKLTFDEMIDEMNNKLAIYYSE